MGTPSNPLGDFFRVGDTPDTLPHKSLEKFFQSHFPHDHARAFSRASDDATLEMLGGSRDIDSLGKKLEPKQWNQRNPYRIISQSTIVDPFRQHLVEIIECGFSLYR